MQEQSAAGRLPSCKTSSFFSSSFLYVSPPVIFSWPGLLANSRVFSFESLIFSPVPRCLLIAEVSLTILALCPSLFAFCYGGRGKGVEREIQDDEDKRLCHLLSVSVWHSICRDLSAEGITCTEHKTFMLSSKRFLLRTHEIESVAEILIKFILFSL